MLGHRERLVVKGLDLDLKLGGGQGSQQERGAWASQIGAADSSRGGRLPAASILQAAEGGEVHSILFHAEELNSKDSRSPVRAGNGSDRHKAGI